MEGSPVAERGKTTNDTHVIILRQIYSLTRIFRQSLQGFLFGFALSLVPSLARAQTITLFDRDGLADVVYDKSSNSPIGKAAYTNKLTCYVKHSFKTCCLNTSLLAF